MSAALLHKSEVMPLASVREEEFGQVERLPDPGEVHDDDHDAYSAALADPSQGSYASASSGSVYPASPHRVAPGTRGQSQAAKKLLGDLEDHGWERPHDVAPGALRSLLESFVRAGVTVMLEDPERAATPAYVASIARALVRDLPARDYEATPLALYLEAFARVVPPDAFRVLVPDAADLSPPEARYKAELLLARHKPRNSTMYHEYWLGLYLDDQMPERLAAWIKRRGGPHGSSSSTVRRQGAALRYDSQRRLLKLLRLDDDTFILTINFDNFQRKYTSRLEIRSNIYLFGVAGFKRVQHPVSMALDLTRGGARHAADGDGAVAVAFVSTLLIAANTFNRPEAVVVGSSSIISDMLAHGADGDTMLRNIISAFFAQPKRSTGGGTPFLVQSHQPSSDPTLLGFTLMFLDVVQRTSPRTKLLVVSVDAGMYPNLDRVLYHLAHLRDGEKFPYSGTTSVPPDVAVSSPVPEYAEAEFQPVDEGMVEVVERAVEVSAAPRTRTRAAAWAASSSTSSSSAGSAKRARPDVTPPPPARVNYAALNRGGLAAVGDRRARDDTVVGSDDEAPVREAADDGAKEGCAWELDLSLADDARVPHEQRAVVETLTLLVNVRWDLYDHELRVKVLARAKLGAREQGDVPSNAHVTIAATCADARRSVAVARLGEHARAALLGRLGADPRADVRKALFFARRNVDVALADPSVIMPSPNWSRVPDPNFVLLMPEMWHANKTLLEALFGGSPGRYRGALWDIVVLAEPDKAGYDPWFLGKHKGFAWMFSRAAMILDAYLVVRRELGAEFRTAVADAVKTALTAAKPPATRGRGRAGASATADAGAGTSSVGAGDTAAASSVPSTSGVKRNEWKPSADQVKAVNLAALMRVLEHTLPVAVLFMDTLAYGDCDGVRDALARLQAALRTVNSVKTANQIVTFLLDWAHLLQSHPEVAASAMASVASETGVFLEHVFGYLSGRLPTSLRDVTVLARHVGMYSTLVQASEFAASYDVATGDAPSFQVTSRMYRHNLDSNAHSVGVDRYTTAIREFVTSLAPNASATPAFEAKSYFAAADYEERRILAIDGAQPDAERGFDDVVRGIVSKRRQFVVPASLTDAGALPSAAMGWVPTRTSVDAEWARGADVRAGDARLSPDQGPQQARSYLRVLVDFVVGNRAPFQEKDAGWGKP